MAIPGRTKAVCRLYPRDGTVRPLCKPGQNQRALCNGHKRVHSIKFQSVVGPNGLIANLYGPVERKRHDSGLLADSGLLNDLSRYSFAPDGTPLCIYGDPAYPLSPGQTIQQSWIPHATLLDVNVEVVAKHSPTLLDETFKFKLALNL